MKTLLLPAAVVAIAGCATPGQTAMDAPASLAAAETAFAAHSMRENMRPAFLANFADDGVLVAGGWTAANAYLATRPNPPIVLDWRPVHVEVAASGELGLSTGPSKRTSLARPGDAAVYGQFVSIWRRRPGEPWKVEVDLGISHPGPTLWSVPLEAVTVTGTGGAGGEASLRTAEENFARESASLGLRAAHQAFASERLRFYRPGVPPILGKTTAMAASEMSDQKLAWFAERAEVARSGDLGYARGRYALASAPEATLGHYLHVWRYERGAWRVALDVTNPLPQK